MKSLFRLRPVRGQKSQKTILLTALFRGDFSTIFALQDLYQELGDEVGLASLLKILDRARWHVEQRSKRKRVGNAESMRRWWRDWAESMNRREKCWVIPQGFRTETDEKFYEWCMKMARASLDFYKSEPVE